MNRRQLFSTALAATLLAVAVPATRAAAAPPSGPYISPWGEAQVTWDPGFKARLDEQHVTVTPITPVTAPAGDTGVISPIGSTSGDYIDFVNFGRVYYPGGWTFTNPDTGGTWTADEFWLRFFPNQGLSTYPVINGVKSPTEQTFAGYTLGSALTGGGGWGLDPSEAAVKTAKVPLALTPDGAAGLNQALGTSFHEGDTLGILSGTFRYLP
ncbi:hypothetical protein [Kitasatospora sp. MAP5-34]|uniref:hypothetical protein n=1 Tax=Kitasatospora sp. MAP5-34 TaxID=3035102 RepID=UPI0024741482|nr:hypothetical protein [Kitasatospora sp. MAP5-34]MDH6576112.1 hypothetical protein [Kitasatospora sp. MAP5-34]